MGRLLRVSRERPNEVLTAANDTCQNYLTGEGAE